MMGGGLVTLEEAKVIRYQDRKEVIKRAATFALRLSLPAPASHST
jgi:hypothetical protein